jgi:TPP-dependent pyruvate/acetoin dehydrogenase alpha subunit
MTTAAETSTIEGVDRGVLLEMFRTVATICAADVRIRAGLFGGEFKFNYYPIRGQEMIPAGVGASLRRDDFMVTTYRCMHDVIGKGAPLTEIFAEMMGRTTGTSKGKGGPMHLSDPNSGLMITTGIVGAGIPIANGLALSAQLRGTGQVTVCNFGDGSTSIGAAHEAFNLAALWALPVIFILQNNQYGEHTAIAGYTKTTSFAERAAAYGMRSVTVDGNDPVAVHRAAAEAAELARSGAGPTFLECVTYRLMGHAFGADTSYMDQAGLAAAMEADPVPAYRQRLLDSGIFSEGELAEVEGEAKQAVEHAVAFAKASPEPGPDELLTDVFAEVGSVPQ